MFKKIIITFIIILLSGLSQASVIVNLIIPWNVGSLTDIVIRKVAIAYERQTGKKIVVKNIVGAQGVLGVSSWKNGSIFDILVTTASTNVFNYADKNLQVSYSTQDFDHFIYLGTMPGLYITRPDTKIHVPFDLKSMMPKSVGGYGSNWNSNFIVLIKDFKLDSQIVEYKNTGQMIIDIVNGNIDIAITAPSPTVLSLVQEGKLHIIGTTYHDDIVLDGRKISPVDRALGIPQFNGFIGLAFRPGVDRAWSNKIREELWLAVNDSDVKESMIKFGIIPDSINDTEKIKLKLDNLHKKVMIYLK